MVLKNPFSHECVSYSIPYSLSSYGTDQNSSLISLVELALNPCIWIEIPGDLISTPIHDGSFSNASILSYVQISKLFQYISTSYILCLNSGNILLVAAFCWSNWEHYLFKSIICIGGRLQQRIPFPNTTTYTASSLDED